MSNSFGIGGGAGLSFGSNINYPYDPNRGAAGRVAADAWIGEAGTSPKLDRL